jgi:16S rRNA (uracil1498-N3)-methyltransferase
MPDFRAHCIPAREDSAELLLSAEESHHLVVVNRAREGDPVVAFDGQGREWDCELSSARKAGAVLRVRILRHAPLLPFSLTLAQAMPKGPCMDAIVRKATEIGARRIIPMETERTQVRLEAGRQDRKTDKWQVAALEAAKQCGNPWLPAIDGVRSLSQVLAECDGDLRLVASLHPGARGLKPVISEAAQRLGRRPRSAVWLVGPEGDFTPAEMSQALAAGFVPVTLGPLVLRCETAAVYALSVLSHELGGEQG